MTLYIYRYTFDCHRLKGKTVDLKKKKAYRGSRVQGDIVLWDAQVWITLPWMLDLCQNAAYQTTLTGGWEYKTWDVSWHKVPAAHDFHPQSPTPRHSYSFCLSPDFRWTCFLQSPEFLVSFTSMDFCLIFSHCCCKSNVDLQSCLVHVAYYSHLCDSLYQQREPGGWIERPSSLYIHRVSAKAHKWLSQERGQPGTIQEGRRGPTSWRKCRCPAWGSIFTFTPRVRTCGRVWTMSLKCILLDQVGNLRSLAFLLPVGVGCFTVKDSFNRWQKDKPPTYGWM